MSTNLNHKFLNNSGFLKEYIKKVAIILLDSKRPFICFSFAYLARKSIKF